MKSLLRQLRLSRRPATQAAAAMLGGRQVRPLPSQKEEAMKAEKELLLEKQSSQSINHSSRARCRSAARHQLYTHPYRDQRRRSLGRLLRGLYPSQRDSAVAGALQASGFTMRSRVDAWEIIYFENSRLVGELKE